jgi:hypothetical protein
MKDMYILHPSGSHWGPLLLQSMTFPFSTNLSYKVTYKSVLLHLRFTSDVYCLETTLT